VLQSELNANQILCSYYYYSDTSVAPMPNAQGMNRWCSKPRAVKDRT